MEHPLETRLKIKDQYKRSYGQDLLDVLKSEISGDFLELMLGLYTDIYEFDAEECHKAIDGLGTAEDTLIEIIGKIKKKELKNLIQDLIRLKDENLVT